MYRIEEMTGFVWKGELVAPYVLTLKEGDFESMLQEVVVLHKKQVKCMRPQEIGDGIAVVQVILDNKESIDPSNEYIVAGMSIYTWFDEVAWVSEVYAYGFERSKLTWVNDVCLALDLWVSLEWGKFIKVLWGKSIDDMSDLCDPNNMVEIYAFLFGICLIYGKFDVEGDVMHHSVIQVPLVESIAALESVLVAMQQVLFAQKVYITIDYQTMKSGQMMQINIDDREILDLRGSRLGWEAYDDREVRELLSWYVWSDRDLDQYVLKLLRK
jgi:hypothetical protein